MELNRIYNIDCLEGIRQMPDCSIDLVITSPPYNKLESKNSGKLVDAVKYDMYSDTMDEINYQDLQVELLSEIYRIIKDDGNVFYNHKNRYINGTMISPLQWLLRTKFSIQQEIVWNRKITGNIRGWRFWNVDERIYWLSKNGSPKRELPPSVACLSSVWEIRPASKKDTGHPCAFPVELASRCIRACQIDRGVCLDPYMGSGTTALAAKAMGLDFIGFELSADYISIAEKRLRKLTGPFQLYGSI